MVGMESAAATVTIEQILSVGLKAGASDVHITVGIAPKMRVAGRIITMNFPALLPPDTHRLLYGIMNERQTKSFEELGEWDFSYAIPNLGRYRVNAFKQRGSCAMVFRLVGNKIPGNLTLQEPNQAQRYHTSLIRSPQPKSWAHHFHLRFQASRNMR